MKKLLRILDYYARRSAARWVFLTYGVEGTHHEKKADGSRARTTWDEGIGRADQFDLLPAFLL
ncbi:MAG: hypothetical protein U0232_19095 [Thermomicrobiales bacterium]